MGIFRRFIDYILNYRKNKREEKKRKEEIGRRLFELFEKEEEIFNQILEAEKELKEKKNKKADQKESDHVYSNQEGSDLEDSENKDFDKGNHNKIKSRIYEDDHFRIEEHYFVRGKDGKLRERNLEEEIPDQQKQRNAEFFKDLIQKIDHRERKDRIMRYVLVVMTTSLIACYAYGVISEANPLALFIKMTNFIEGQITLKPDLQYNQEEANEYDIYKVGYMTEDHVLMREEEQGKIYKMEYYKDSTHFVFISQASEYDKKYLSSNDQMEHEPIFVNGVEYHYSYNEAGAISILYFVKGNTSIYITGTIEKDDILRIAEGLYKE